MTAPVIPVVTSEDGPTLTVNDLLKDPRVIPQTILRMLEQKFLVDVLFRNAGRNDAGIFRFDESTPLFSDSELRLRAEGGEIPLASFSRGTPQAVQSEERPLAMMVTDEDRRRNNVRSVQDRMTQLENTIVQGWDDAFLDYFFGHPRIPEYAVATSWEDPNADTRTDIMRAAQVIVEAEDTRGSRFGFRPDTILMSDSKEVDLRASKAFNEELRYGNVANQNLRYTGGNVTSVLGYTVVTSHRVPAGHAVMMQRGRTGFYGDELPLESTEMYRDEPRKCSRSDTQRITAMGIDQPKSAVILSGV